MTTAMTPITKRNPTKAPNPSVERASIRTPAGGGGGGGVLAGKTCIHIDMVSYPALASAGTTFSTRIVRLCSPSPTARNCCVDQGRRSGRERIGKRGDANSNEVSVWPRIDQL